MKRVVAYCRVSTDHEDQKNSLEAQKRFFDRYVNSKKDWILEEIYKDEGITGTNTNKRDNFKRMIADGLVNKYDMIITKEISRFARNTVDTLVYVRQLKAKNIGIYFMIEDIFSLDDDAEYKITQYASNAQEESHKTSRRVKWGISARMEEGFTFGNRVYGYYLENGTLAINENEAKVIRLIFDLYLNQGLGVRRILKHLESKGIPSPSGKTVWEKTSILRMLQNEKYEGTLKQKKEITIDFLSHKRVKNTGIEDFIIIENHHEPIVSREMFQAVQEEIKHRSAMMQDKEKYSNRYCFSTKIKCALCGSSFTRRHRKPQKDNNHIIWQCKENINNGTPKIDKQGNTKGCNARAIHESYLKDCFLTSFNQVIENKDIVIEKVKEAVYLAMEQKGDHSREIQALTNEIKKVRNRRLRLIELFTDGEIDKETFTTTNQQYASSLADIENQKFELEQQETEKADLQKKLDRVQVAISSMARCEVFSDNVCASVLDKVEVHSRDKICFFLRIIEKPIFFIDVSPLCITQPGRLEQRGRRGHLEQRGRRGRLGQRGRRGHPGI